VSWPTTPSSDTFAVPEGREDHRLDVYLNDGKVVDVHLDGESVWPTWFKLEWKGNGELSAKVRGVRLSSRYGDEITIHQAAAAGPSSRAAPSTGAARPGSATSRARPA
jgi:hypothetical protein